MLKHWPIANYAKRHFFKYRNTVNIFTEDNPGDKEFYVALFYRLFEGRDIIINDVQPIWCKDDVISRHDSCSTSELRDSVFIVDGDLDLITGKNRKSSNSLIVLDSYCIENYLFDEEWILEILHTLKCDTPKYELKKRLNFKKIYSNFECINELFIHFALLRLVWWSPKIRSLGYFYDNWTLSIDNSKIQTYLEEIISEIKTRSTSYDNDIAKLRKKWPIDSPETFLRIPSWKDYLLQLISFKIKEFTNKRDWIMDKSSLKMYLIKNINLTRLDFLKQLILSK